MKRYKHKTFIKEETESGNNENCKIGISKSQSFVLPNQIFANGKVSIGEFSNTEEARTFPFENRWCVQWSERRMDEYKAQGIRVLIICDWERQDNDQFKYVLATVKPNHIIYWDFDDVRFDNSPNAVQEYEGGLGTDAVEIIHKIATINKENLNCNKNMKKVVRLTVRNDLHRIVKNSVKRILQEGNETSSNLGNTLRQIDELCGIAVKQIYAIKNNGLPQVQSFYDELMNDITTFMSKIDNSARCMGMKRDSDFYFGGSHSLHV